MPKITLLKRPTTLNTARDRPKSQVRPGPRIPTPTRKVPKELAQVDLMTSADFRHDFSAHLDNMRTRQQNQKHMQFFSEAFHQNKHLFKGRVILVICCGIGTLALMAAKAGAKRVYAVDYSKVTGYAELVVKQNHLEKVIKVLHGRMKDLKLPEEVDGIVCNWMGHCLLWECEILEVITARDRWLKKRGFILPDRASLFILGSEEHKLKNDRCNWWLNVYGFNMKAMRRYAVAEPRYAKTTGEKILTLAHRVLELDLMTVQQGDVLIDRKFRLKVNREGYLECFMFYFDVEFTFSHTPLRMSCNPCLKSTQKAVWQQTVLFVEHPFVMRSNHFYSGYLKFSPLNPDSFKEMEIRIDFFQCNAYDEDLASDYCHKLVGKRWLMLEHFQTEREVDSCQEETVGLPNY
nr:protein arginine N-methyltransferase 1 [Drosophila bipectinata]